MATVLVTTGKEWMIDSLDSTAGEVSPSYLMMATGAGTAAAGDTGLFGSAIQAKTTATCDYQSAADTFTVIGVITLACTAADITNAGSFTATSSAASGGLYVHGDHTTIAGLAQNDQVQYTINLQIT